MVEVALGLAGHVEAAVESGETPLVIGGDCTIELGVLSGILRAGGDPALLYFDGGVDLRTPETNPTGILDSMGVAHMVAEPGSAEELAHVGPTPLPGKEPGSECGDRTRRASTSNLRESLPHPAQGSGSGTG